MGGINRLAKLLLTHRPPFKLLTIVVLGSTVGSGKLGTPGIRDSHGSQLDISCIFGPRSVKLRIRCSANAYCLSATAVGAVGPTVKY